MSVDTERELYPITRTWLIRERGCSETYSGFKLYFGKKHGIIIDVYGLSRHRDDQDPILYLCEGKRELRQSISTSFSQAWALPQYGDYVYLFGMLPASGEIDSTITEGCKSNGYGILVIDDSLNIEEILPPKRQNPREEIKDMLRYRIFLQKIKDPIAALIFQGAYEMLLENAELKKTGIPFIDIYGQVFKNEDTKQLMNEILGYHSLEARDVRKAFQSRYGRSQLVEITRANDILDDIIWLTDEGMKDGLAPILLQ